jgi:hypothetical protein
MMKRLVWLIVASNAVALVVGSLALAVFYYGDAGRRSSKQLRATLKPGMSYNQVEALARRPGTFTACEGPGGPTPCQSRRLRVSTQGQFGMRWYFIGEFDANGRLAILGDVTLDSDSEGPG